MFIITHIYCLYMHIYVYVDTHICVHCVSQSILESGLQCFSFPNHR